MKNSTVLVQVGIAIIGLAVAVVATPYLVAFGIDTVLAPGLVIAIAIALLGLYRRSAALNGSTELMIFGVSMLVLPPLFYTFIFN